MNTCSETGFQGLQVLLAKVDTRTNIYCGVTKFSYRETKMKEFTFALRTVLYTCTRKIELNKNIYRLGKQTRSQNPAHVGR